MSVVQNVHLRVALTLCVSWSEVLYTFGKVTKQRGAKSVKMAHVKLCFFVHSSILLAFYYFS